MHIYNPNTRVVVGTSQLTTTSLFAKEQAPPHLAGSLRWLKRYEGDFEPLSLNFAVDVDTGGGAPRAVPLVPGGEAIAVTRENRSEFVLRVAHYRLNSQLRRAVAAFARGFELLVPRQWIAMFSPAELQLILGGSDAPLNVAVSESLGFGGHNAALVFKRRE